jgi:hypothetical protein
MSTTTNMSNGLAVHIGHYCFDTNSLTRPGSWTLHLLTTQATKSGKGVEMTGGWYSAQSITPTAENDSTYPGVFWNTAKVDFGTPSTDGGNIVGLLLQDGNNTNNYYFYDLASPIDAAAGADINSPLNQFIETLA